MRDVRNSVSVAAALCLAAILGCRFGEHESDVDLDDAGWSSGDSALPHSECTQDFECDVGECCGGSGWVPTCVPIEHVDPTKSVCSLLTAGTDNVCWCTPPEGATVCPGLFTPPPLTSVCSEKP